MPYGRRRRGAKTLAGAYRVGSKVQTIDGDYFSIYFRVLPRSPVTLSVGSFFLPVPIKKVVPPFERWRPAPTDLG